MTTFASSIVVIALPGIGDVLVTTPLLAALRTAYPNARIDLLIRDGMRGIVEGNPDIDDVIEVPPRAGIRATMRALLGRFRAYDVVLSNSASDRAFFYALFLGRKRIGRLLPRKGVFGIRHALHANYTIIDAERHALTETNELGRMIGVDVETSVVVPSSPNAPERLDALLGNTWREQPYAVIHPGPSLAHKRWKKKGWHAVVERLHANGLHVFVSGGPGESEKDYLENELRLGADRITSIAGQTSLAEMAALLSRARICVCVDTLIGHIATAVGTPAVVLFGGTNLRQWGPWPYGQATTKSPYEPSGSQRIANVYVIHVPADVEAVAASRTTRTPHGSKTGLDRLDAASVVGAIDTMLQANANSDILRR